MPAENTPIVPVPKGFVGSLKVWCSFDELVPLESLRPHPQNPNSHPDRQLELLGLLFEGNGIRHPIVVSRQSGYITKGEGRYLTAKRKGMVGFPVEYQDYESEAQELADVVADNKIQELSAWDEGKLNSLLVTLDTGEFNMELTGFDFQELEKRLASINLDNKPVEGDGSTGELTDAKPPGSHVRMVQLFLDETNIQEFLEKISALEKYFGKDNVTDTVLESVRATYQSIQPVE